MSEQNQQSPYYQNDQWTIDDTLGLGHAGDQVAKMIVQVTPPFTLGVTGKWGSGKTSVMRRAYATLGGLPLEQELAFANAARESLPHEQWRFDKPERKRELSWAKVQTEVAELTHCVWFSPWQHQSEANPLVPLLQEIRSQFSTWEKIRGYTNENKRKAAYAVVSMLENLTDLALTLCFQKNVKVVSGMTENARKVWNETDPNLLAKSDGQRFHLLFEDAVKTILSTKFDQEEISKQARMVIFIDDLDRCEESVIVRLLEVIKLYLSTERCVFVLGLDDTAVMNALCRYWQRSEDLNREYLEKLFQVRIPVPLPQSPNIAELVTKQLTKHGILQSTLMATDIEKLLEPNPRKVKNFVNGLCISWEVSGIRYWQTAEAQGKPEPQATQIKDTIARKFVLFHYLQQYHRSVWRILERQPGALPYLFAVLQSAAKGQFDLIPDDTKETNIDASAQRLLIEVFKRAFSHVLPHEQAPEDIDDYDSAPKPSDKGKHGSEDLDAAIANFLDRQDRKRSDEYFRTAFLELVDANEHLNCHFLYAHKD